MTAPGDVVALRAEVDRLQEEVAVLRTSCRALEESEAQYRNVADLSKAGICIIHRRCLCYVNNRMVEILARSREDLLGRPFEDFVHPEEIPKVLEAQENFDTCNRFDQCFETAVVDADGRRVDVELALTMTPFEQHRAGLVLLYDISARIRAEGRIRQLTQQLMRVQEEERLRIARYLHDQVAQDLSTLKILCATLFDGEAVRTERLQTRLGKVSDQLQRTIDAVRALAYDLRPPGLDQLGLARTMLHDCEAFATETGLPVDFSSAGLQDLSLAAELEINFYRIFQEALRNVRRHADAGRVTVRLVASSPHIVLRVQDNGRGFRLSERQEAARQERRMGLQSMEERARLLGGRLNITTRPGKGTSLYVEAPMMTV